MDVLSFRAGEGGGMFTSERVFFSVVVLVGLRKRKRMMFEGGMDDGTAEHFLKLARYMERAIVWL